MRNQVSFCGSYQDSISRMLHIVLKTCLTVKVVVLSDLRLSIFLHPFTDHSHLLESKQRCISLAGRK